MKKKKGLFLLLFLGFTLLLVFLGFLANSRIKMNLEEQLRAYMEFENIEVDFLGGQIEMENPRMEIQGVEVRADLLNLEGLGYYQYFRNDRIVIDRIYLNNPEVESYGSREDTSKANANKPFQQDLLIRSLEIDHGSFRIFPNDSSDNSLFLDLNKLTLKKVKIDSGTVKKKVPFTYGSIKMGADSIFLDLDARHYLTTGRTVLNNSEVSVEKIRIIPRYSKTEFQKHVFKETDRYDLGIQKIDLEDFSWKIENDSLWLETSLMAIKGANLEVYRNKLLPDDESFKGLYSSKLQELPAKIGIARVEVTESSIVYQEKNSESREPATVSFQKVSGTVSDLTNIGMGKKGFAKTQIHVTCLFYNETPLEVDWSFDISNKRDEFRISGKFGALSSEGINSFLVPSMMVEARGGIEFIAFDFFGNSEEGVGDVHLRYEDFKINILRDEGKKINKLFSSIANFFIKNDSTDEDYSRKDLKVKRNKSKSFWNFIWLFLREGAIDSFL